MSEIIKDRSSIENEYKWDLTPLYASDSAWEEDILTLDKLISDAASFKGSLDSAGNISNHKITQSFFYFHITQF